jgi:hypothetical protein
MCECKITTFARWHQRREPKMMRAIAALNDYLPSSPLGRATPLGNLIFNFRAAALACSRVGAYRMEFLRGMEPSRRIGR